MRGRCAGARRLAALALTAAALLSCALPAQAAGEEPAVVRVGVYESNGFIALNDDDEMTGYGARFMALLAQYANIRYEYVRLTWNECLEQLLTGGIDIVTDARRTAQRDELYDFSVQCIGQIQAAIFVPKDMEDIYFNDYERLRTLRVGFEEGALNKTLYEEYARQHGYTAVTAEYPTDSALRRALAVGEIDAFGNDAHQYTDDLKVVSIYNTDPNYIMAAKGSALMQRLNLAIGQMYAEHPDMISDQYTYLADRQMYGALLLTREQAAYIAQNPVVRVAVPADRKPASWYDEECDQFHGIAIDMMAALSDITGLRFEYVPVDEITSPSSLLAQAGIDVAMPIVSSEYYTGALPLQTTAPLYSLSVAMSLRDEDRLTGENGLTVAVKQSNDGIAAMLNAYFDGLTIKRYPTSQACIDAVRAGETDAFGNAMYEMEYLLKSPRNDDLHIAYSYTCPIDYCLALRADADDTLINILNGGIALIPQADADRIIRYHSTFLQYETTFADRLYASRVLILCTALILLVVFVAWGITATLQRRALAAIRQKSAEAQRANAAKSEFLARMSHDMRTPMNGILGIAALTVDKDMPEDVRQAFRQISGEGQFLLGLINDTLDMSKIENKQLTLDVRDVDSAELMDETMRLIRAYAGARHVTCTLRQENVRHGLVRVDKLRVQQVIMNILSNAVKFSPAGGTVELYLETWARENGVDRNKFVITDHGAGMSPEFLPRLFEPFEQERDPDAPAHHEGSGLGMSITKHLVDMMGGRIEVASAKGVGTTVTVWLDFPRCPEQTPAAKAAPDGGPLPPGLRVLLCEDNEMNTLVAAGFLKKAGCAVDCAVNGQEGVELFRASARGYYDAVLMDIRMPVMDGIQATGQIRALDRPDARSVPIIALTANAFEDEVRQYLAGGMNAHIAKPIDPERLYAVLRDCAK